MELINNDDSRIIYLNKRKIVCPKCKSRVVEVIQEKFFPKWHCFNCKTRFIYEPIVLLK